jgi:alpha-galactosidase
VTRSLLVVAVALALGAGPGASSDETRIEPGADGTSWTLTNGLVERHVLFGDVQGLRTSVFRRVESGTDFLGGDADGSVDPEFGVRIDGEAVRGASAAFELLGAEVTSLEPAGKALVVRLAHRQMPVEVDATYAIYDGHAVTRKWVTLTNHGDAPLTLTGLIPEWLELAPGLPMETQVSGFHGVFGREAFLTGRVDDGLILLRNARSGEGLAVLNEVPGYLKRTDILGFNWTSGVRCGYDTDLFPFERSLEPGETFTSAPCSIAVFAEGEGVADPRFVLPSYTSSVLLRKGASYQPPWIYNTWEPFYRRINEARTRELVEVLAPLGFDVFTIDDGWQKMHGANEVWEKTFPSGLEPIQARVEEAGMRLGLWYPLAAVDPGIAEYVEHPEWAARERDGEVKRTGTAAGTKVVMCMATPYRTRAARRLADLIGMYNLRYVKIDLTTVFNTYGESPGCHAEGHEHRTWAESLTRIYEGVRDLTAMIYREHPDVLLDLTFELWGKKHLIDAGLLAAGDLDWLSNVHDSRPDSAGPLQARTLLYHRALAVPVEAMLIGNLRMNTAPAAVRLATAMGSGPVLLGDPRGLTEEQRDLCAERIRWFKALRREVPIQEGFFPQGAWRQPGLTTWDGFARLSRGGEGLLVLFRNEASTGRARVRWAAPEGRTWVLRPVPDGSPLGPFGATALRDGIEVPLPGQGETKVFEVRRAAAGQ